MSFIDDSGLGARTRAETAQQGDSARRRRGPMRKLPGAGTLWTALVTGAGGSATMVLASMGSTTERPADPMVTLTIADPACVGAPASCYPIDAIPEFGVYLKGELAKRGDGAAAGGAAGASVILRPEGGLEREAGENGEPAPR